MDAIVTVAAVSPFGCVSTIVLLRALPKCESGRGTSWPVRDDSVCKVISFRESGE